MDEPQEAPQLQHSPDLQVDVHGAEPGERWWQYRGGVERVYTNVPVTIKHHEMIKWPEVPAEDGHWVEVEWSAESGFTEKLADNAPTAPNPEDAIIASQDHA